MRTLRPPDRPSIARPCSTAPAPAAVSGSFSAAGISTPIRRIRSPCRARAVNGNATAPPMSVMNSRRLTWDMGLLLDVMRLRYTGDRPQEQRAFRLLVDLAAQRRAGGWFARESAFAHYAGPAPGPLNRKDCDIGSLARAMSTVFCTISTSVIL